MKKLNRIIIAMSSLCLAFLSGCNINEDIANRQDSPKKNTESNLNHSEKTKVKDSKMKDSPVSPDSSYNSADEMFEDAGLSGTVLEFNDAGCTISKFMEGEEPNVVIEAAEGNNDPAIQADIVYDESTKFQKAVVDYNTGQLVSLDDCGKSELLKQSTVLLYGSYHDDGSFQAIKVIIVKNA